MEHPDCEEVTALATGQSPANKSGHCAANRIGHRPPNKSGRHPSSSAAHPSVCVLCQQSHSLEACKQTHKMKMEEHTSFLRKKGYCYGCLDGDHLKKVCWQRKVCATCGALHPTLLHWDKGPAAPASAEKER